MKKTYRVRKNKEFTRIIGERHSVASANFVVYFSLKKEKNCRVGISVSKKLGNAVERNKIKRQMREMAKALINFESSKYDYIIIARVPYINHGYHENINDLEKLLKKAIIV